MGNLDERFAYAAKPCIDGRLWGALGVVHGASYNRRYHFTWRTTKNPCPPRLPRRIHRPESGLAPNPSARASLHKMRRPPRKSAPQQRPSSSRARSRSSRPNRRSNRGNNRQDSPPSKARRFCRPNRRSNRGSNPQDSLPSKARRFCRPNRRSSRGSNLQGNLPSRAMRPMPRPSPARHRHRHKVRRRRRSPLRFRRLKSSRAGGKA